MSRAFVTERDDRGDGFDLPEPVLPPGARNHITPEGATRLRAERDALAAELAELEVSAAPTATDRKRSVQGRLRYLDKRIATFVETPTADNPDRVVFGASVTVADPDGNERTVRIVGVDEVEPAKGLVSWVSPLAKAILGRAPGEVVTLRTPKGDEDLEIVGVSR
jgi:transcription elongation factor GreB